MSKKQTLEQAYFHINNGGLTFSIVEKIDVRKVPPMTYMSAGFCEHANEVPGRCPCPPACYCKQPGLTCGKNVPKRPLAMTNRRWLFRVTTNHFGTATKYEFPLVPVMVRWMQSALNRVLTRMETPTGLPTDGLEFALRQDDCCWVKVEDGQVVEGEERVVETAGGAEKQSP